MMHHVFCTILLACSFMSTLHATSPCITGNGKSISRLVLQLLGADSLINSACMIHEIIDVHLER